MPLNANGTFAAGTFAGGARLAAAVDAAGLGLGELADALDLPAEQVHRIVVGGAPLPATARYTHLVEMLAVLGSPLDPRMLYLWVEADRDAWSKAKGLSVLRSPER